MRKDSGFSFIELVTIMGILALMATIAVPNLLGWRSNANLRRASQDLYSTFYKAKTEAVRRNVFVTLTFRADDFIIYVDANDDWSFDTVDGDLKIVGPVSWSQYPGVSVDSMTFNNPLAPDGIGFSGKGFPMNKDDKLVEGTIVLTNQKNRQNSISITPAGSIRIKRLP